MPTTNIFEYPKVPRWTPGCQKVLEKSEMGESWLSNGKHCAARAHYSLQPTNQKARTKMCSVGQNTTLDLFCKKNNVFFSGKVQKVIRCPATLHSRTVFQQNTHFLGIPRELMLGIFHVYMIQCPGELVDRPTQLVCIWIFICCQQTNIKDIAG